jgi:hypothetical protein
MTSTNVGISKIIKTILHNTSNYLPQNEPTVATIFAGQGRRDLRWMACNPRCTGQRYSVASRNIVIKQMKTSKLVSLIVVLAFACAPLAQAVKNGFDTTCTQGGSTQPCHNDNGTETSGPHGQVKQDKTANTTTCGPGNSTGC